MIVSFDTSELLSVCSNLDHADREIGPADARALHVCLSDMEALDTAAEFLEIAADDATVSGGAMMVAVGGGHRAEFVPVGTRYRREPDGRLDWSTVRYLKLTTITRCA